MKSTLFTIENIKKTLELGSPNISLNKINEEKYELDTYTKLNFNEIIEINFKDTNLDPNNPDDFVSLLRTTFEKIDIDVFIDEKRKFEEYKNEYTIREFLNDYEDWLKNISMKIRNVIALKY